MSSWPFPVGSPGPIAVARPAVASRRLPTAIPDHDLPKDQTAADTYGRTRHCELAGKRLNFWWEFLGVDYLDEAGASRRPAADPKGHRSKLGVTALSTTLFISADGVLRGRRFGELDTDRLRAAIHTYLGAALRYSERAGAYELAGRLAQRVNHPPCSAALPVAPARIRPWRRTGEPVGSRLTQHPLQSPVGPTHEVCVATGLSICIGTKAEVLEGLDENRSDLPCRELRPWFRCSVSLVEGTFMSGVFR